MAKKRYFKINSDFTSIEKKLIEYTYHKGFAVSQKVKNINSIHEAIKEREKDAVILEVSSKSQDDLGVKLSAFNLSISAGKRTKTVESIFQGSKVFENGGPFKDLITKSSLEAKKDPRIKASGDLVGFEYNGEQWPLNPTTLFYDWVYIHILDINVQDEKISLKELLKYNTFTDVEFNQNKSLNCQAGAVALYLVLHQQNLLDKYLYDKEKFKEAVENLYVEVDKPEEKPKKRSNKKKVERVIENKRLL